MLDGLARSDGVFHERAGKHEAGFPQGGFHRSADHLVAFELELDLGVAVDGHHMQVGRVEHEQADGQVAQQGLQELAFLFPHVLLGLAAGDVVEQAYVLAAATAFVQHLDGVDLTPVRVRAGRAIAVRLVGHAEWHASGQVFLQLGDGARIAHLGRQQIGQPGAERGLLGPTREGHEGGVDPLDHPVTVGDGHTTADAGSDQAQPAEVLCMARHAGEVGIPLSDKAELDGGDVQHALHGRRSGCRVIELEQGQGPAFDGHREGQDTAGAFGAPGVGRAIR